jgi:D-arabinose 1-dehydrogenase-like Zn-dependent alcohol dehydrogenase
MQNVPVDLHEINEAYERMPRRAVKYRFMIDMASL